ncbi:interferon-induced very large GTPase 1-like [Lithobates pipiens]
MNNSKVKVAVRVRPLNQREDGLNSECVVRVSGNQITLLPPISCKEKERKEPHIFTYDNCFWTKDKYDTGQEDVFEHLGDGVLENIWLGYNVCIFAYGQTGSGKTFSMMGTDDQPGIVPRICTALFNKESSDLEAIRIEASYLEIYNEEVRDLLRLEKKQTKLRVREDRLLGPYVEELSCHAVQSYEEIKLLLDQGNKHRAIAETKMNEQSSRSHAILALTVTQTRHKMSHDHKSGASRELVSKVSLVDLAGSERSSKSGAQGSQLKECFNINKSLLTLGLVINSLAEISENKRKSQHVKYRDSVLTWLLKNNLGGNSKTIMLATVSPAADNYQETLSTLKYAESAKRIVNQAVVNEDVKSKAIEELQEEIKRLREQLTTTEHVKAEVIKLKSQLEEKENLLNVLQTSWEEKLKRTEVATKEWQKNLENMGIILKKQNVTFSNECYLIQRDTLIIHNINDITKIGSGPSQDIQISGPEAECEHCVIRKTEEGEVFLTPVNNSKIYINGCLSKTKTQLWHEDKIHIGTNVFDLQQPSRPKPEYMKTNVSSEAEAQTYDELNTEKGRSSILSEREGRNSNMIENEKSKTKSAFYKATESSAPTIPASDDDLNSNESNSQPIDMKVNTAKSEYLEIGDGTEVQDFMVPCSPQYGEASSQTSEILGNNNCLQSTQDLEDNANLPRYFKKEILFKEKMKMLLEKMKIGTEQTSKLTLQKVLEIGPESLMTDEPCDDNALWYFVRRLMSLNGEARNINTLFIKSEESESESESESNKDDSFTLLFENDLQNDIHPLDVVFVAFHCSDHFLQQEMISKMSMCQFAVPLLLPDVDGPECTFMLWAMRGIVKKWRPQSLSDSKGFMEDSLVNVSMPTISFVRLGNCRLSKSKMLNHLLGTSQHQHEHFIHRDMEGGNAPRKISDGLVEISWYFPGGKGKFPEPVAFTNLRGELESNVKKFDFLTEISSVVVILTDGISKDQYELLKKYNSHNTKYLLIISPEDTRMMEDTRERLNLLTPVLNLTKDNVLSIPRNANETKAVSKIYSSLLSKVQNNIKTLSLETLAKQASRHGIRIDEDFEECQKAQLTAKEITDEIEDVEKYKKETMKLQAKPLKEMAKLEKEMCQMKRQGNSNGEKYKSDLRKKCEVIRQEQWNCNISSGISKFVNAITSINTSEKFYFLQWLKFHLDVKARKCLYPLRAQYKETCHLPDKQAELTKLDQRISDSSLGIEHFLREVSQFYEAWYYMGRRGKLDINFASLPRIAADLLLDGFPLELIDGDASRIPLQWVKDVLCELNKKVKGKDSLRVITVLGVQSTGKSTLLNTMFGLQFPVASGRCTRGAFMTLLKVKENFQSYFMCEFILVIDTEGLKAPELDSLDGSYEHDNELATLVIGLSDITLINMSMENTSVMKDILQIVIHAFLRMKQIGKKPNCQFVHQNVSDVSAHSMNMRGRKKLMDQLDEMTRTVAATEKNTQFKSFSDIMEYDLEHDNCYIAGLWHGVPPMASVNSAYSENVNELKQKLLKLMRDRHNKTQNINEFISWVSDLWSAVKHENFIFSFRNSLIAKAYNQLSIKYSERDWKFNKLMYEWLTESETTIKNQSAATLEAKANECKKEAECILTREGGEIVAWLEEFFSKETDGAQLIKYKSDFVISAQNLRKSLEISSITKLNETIQIRKDNIRVEDVCSQQIERIEQQVSNFIEERRQRKHEPSNAELEKELERIWNNTAKDLKVSNRKERDIEGEMLLVLTKDMKERGSAVNEKIQKTKHFPKPKKQQNPSLFSQEYTTVSYQYKKWKGDFRYEDFFQNVLHKCINYYSKKKTQIDADYDDTYCREILKIIDEHCKNDDAMNYFSADREFDLKLTILGHVLDGFQQMHFNFLQKDDPHARLNSLKPVYFDSFKNAFQKKNESKSLAERVCENIFKPSLTDHINRKLGIEMVDDIVNSKDSEKYTSRMFFQLMVLENLLEEDNFKNYVNYSSDYKNFAKSWITNYIVKEYKNISTLQVRILSNIMGRVRSSLNNPPALNLKDVSDFLSHLCEKLNSDLVIPQQTMKAIISQNSAAIEDFIHYMRLSLTDTEAEIRAELESLSTEDVLSRLVVKPQDELFKKVFGCGKQCPFCKVPCEAGGTDHEEHFASVHRPDGLGRYRWSATEVLSHDICTTSVVGNGTFKNELTEWNPHPYKDYRDFYPDWKIQPDESIEASDYWKFILKEYNEQFAAEYNAKPANYPEEWNKLTREMAKKSLQKTFNM